jgi:DNA mismatch repair protein MutS
MNLSQSTTTNRPRLGFSLLWPPGAPYQEETSPLDPSAAHDLGLDFLVRALSTNEEHRREIRATLESLTLDLDVIQYRQDIMSDMLENPDLATRLEALMPTIDSLARYAYRTGKDMNTLHEVTWRLGELQGIVEATNGLAQSLEVAGDRLKSEGLGGFKREIDRTRATEIFQSLVRELPGLLAQVRSIASITIGVNLDQFLRPVEATLLAVHETRFSGQSILGRLFGNYGRERQGIAPLHSVPRREVDGPYALPVDPELGRAVDPLMVPLFEDLAMVIEKITAPLAEELSRYAKIRSQMFVALHQELAFYLGGLRLVRRLRAHGLPVCLPELAPPEKRTCQVEEAYNPNLALHLSAGDRERDLSKSVVRNSIDLGENARIAVLTGPNQGGKTTYIQACGLIQLLAQAGLPVPGKQARISPVDNIYTHFPLEEKPESGTGRFGDEARRLAEVFQHLTRHSLVLLNEALSGTNTGESIYLAQDVVRILRRVGARAIYSTHMHDLAAGADEINRSTPGDSRVASLISSPVEDPTSDGQKAHAGSGEVPGVSRSYKIEARPPMGRSYAHQIAARYGISYRQLEQMLVERGILNDEV